MDARRAGSFGVVLVVALGAAGCRDLVFDGGRVGDRHVLRGRVPSGITTAEVERGWFVSRTADLAPLEAALRGHADGTLRMYGSLDPRIEGTATIFDLGLIGVDGLPGALRLATVRFSDPLVSPAMPVDRLRTEYRTLCEHPTFGEFFPEIGPASDPCNPLDFGDAEDILVDATFDIRRDGITAAWVPPSTRLNREWSWADPDAPGACPDACACGFECPAGAPAGTACVAASCRAAEDCSSDPTFVVGECRRGRCEQYTCVTADRDFSDEAPVLAVSVPIDVDTDLLDYIAILFGTFDFDRMVAQYRVQPVACGSGGCRTPEAEPYFVGYRNSTAGGDVVFSDSNVDVRLQGTATDVRVRVTPGLGLFLGCIFPPACMAAVESIKDEIRRTMRGAVERNARLLDSLAEAKTLGTVELPADLVQTACVRAGAPSSVCAGVAPVLARHARVDLGLSSVLLGGETDPVPLGGPGGALGDNTVRAFALGGTITTAAVDMSAFAGVCADPAACGGAIDGGGPAPDAGAPDERCVVCDLCRRYRPDSGDIWALCDFGVAGLPVPPDPMGRTVIPASPTVAPLVDMGANFALEARRLFTVPLERVELAYETRAEYTRTLYCPSETAPADCPAGADGAVFFFLDDLDGDSVRDGADNCPREPNPGQQDGDGDGLGDACDGCPCHLSTSALDTDGDGVPNACDCDSDGDGCNNPDFGELVTTVPGCEGVSPCVSNGEDGLFDEDSRACERDRGVSGACANTDGDPWIDDCDRDDDGDGILDDGAGDGPIRRSPCTGGETMGCDDNCEDVYNPDQADAVGNGIGDACDRLCRPSGPPMCSGAGDPHFGRPAAFVPGLLPLGECIAGPLGCERWAVLGCRLEDLIVDRCVPGPAFVQQYGQRGGLVSSYALAGPPKPIEQPPGFPPADLETPLGGLEGMYGTIPDVDGDGLLEIVFGSPAFTRCTLGGGCAASAGEIVALASSTGGLLFRMSPAGAGAEFGTAVARSGALLLVGAPGAIDAGGRPTGGVFRIVLEPAPRVDGAFFGEAAGERFGESVVAVVGPDGESLGFLVGAPRARIAGRGEAGVIRFVTAEGAVLAEMLGPFSEGHMGARMTPILPSAFFPRHALASPAGAFGAGRRTDDGARGFPPQSGVLAGIPEAGGGDGAVAFFRWDGRLTWTLEGEPGEALGMSMAHAADFDGDGRCEVVVGAPGASSAAGRLYLASPRGRIERLFDGAAGDRLGRYVAAPGDVDADGAPDLLVAMPGRTLPGETTGGTIALIPGAGAPR